MVQRALVVLLCAMAVGESISTAVAAPPVPTLPAATTFANSQPTANAVTFVKVLETLSRHYKVAFIVEDEPLAEVLPATTLTEAMQDSPNLSSEESTQRAVEKCADAFDYSAVRLGGVFLLQKRYKKFAPFSGELPSVTFQECAFVSYDTERAMGALNPHVRPFGFKADGRGGYTTEYPLGDPIMKSLTQDQLSAMFNGWKHSLPNSVDGKPIRGVMMNGMPAEESQQKSSKGTVDVGLPIRSLSREQRADVQRIAAYYFIQYPLDRMEDAFVKLEAVSNPDAVFRFESYQIPGYQALRLLGCVVPSKRMGGKPQWHLLFEDYDPKINTTPTPSAYPEAFYARYEVVGAMPNFGFPKDTPNLETILAKMRDDTQATDAAGRTSINQMHKRRTSGFAQTLAQVAEQVNTRSAGIQGRVTVAVDPALAAKRVTLIGTEQLSSLSLWTSIARLYDLSTRQMADGSILLTRPRQKVAREFADVPDTMQHILPLPLRRLATYNQQKSLRDAAMAQFHTIVSERPATSPTDEFSLKDLDDEGRQCLGLMLMYDEVIRNMLRLAEPAPTYITNFDDHVILGGLFIDSKGETKFSLFFGNEVQPAVSVQGKEISPAVLKLGVGFAGVKYEH